MKLVMTLLVRDEQDILRENLDFHLAHGVDEIVLMDNRSVDGTAEIAREYERAGYLHYMFQPQDDYSQGRWVTQMARRAIDELRADWVINNDADEFWWPHAGSLKDAFASIGPDPIAATAERTNFVTRTESGEPFWRRMDVRNVVSVNALGDPLPGKSAHRAARDVVIGQGNHYVFVDDALAPQAAAPVTILHFPVRSRSQFFNKIAKGGAAYARNTELPYHAGLAWRRLYEQYLEGRLDEAYDSALLTEERVAGGLANGDLVRDRRLIDALDARAHAPSAIVR
jgi:glycosyltransferase involved in cell wall biosynthesis